MTGGGSRRRTIHLALNRATDVAALRMFWLGRHFGLGLIRAVSDAARLRIDPRPW
jgi:hypothetical protein